MRKPSRLQSLATAQFRRARDQKAFQMKTIPKSELLNQIATPPPHALSGSVERQGARNRGSAAEENSVAPGAREERASADAAAGLVTCAKSVRELSPPGVSPGRFPFPTVDECRAGAATVGGWAWDGREGPVPTLEVYPGLVRLTAPDLNRREKTANKNSDAPVILSMGEGQEPEDARRITGWSRRSRARMAVSYTHLTLPTTPYV